MVILFSYICTHIEVAYEFVHTQFRLLGIIYSYLLQEILIKSHIIFQYLYHFCHRFLV